MHSDNSLFIHRPALDIYIVVLLLLITGGSRAASLPHILLLSETNGWDHQTRTVADSVITALGERNGFTVTATHTTDGYFTAEYLTSCAAVCFINTTGTIFTDEEATVFESYIKEGGGFAGVHAATDCEYDRSWYAEMTGANFNGHPFNIAEAKIAVLDKNHPSTNFIVQDTLLRIDEWYFWAENPAFADKPLVDPADNDSITVLMELVESSIDGSTLNHFHPICWSKSFGNGRVWYCGFGHDPETFKNPLIVQMLLGGIQDAAGIQNTECNPRPPVNSVIRTASDRVSLYDCKGRVIPHSAHTGAVKKDIRAVINGASPAHGVYFASGKHRHRSVLNYRQKE